MSKEAMKLALEHIEGNYTVSAEDAIKALEEALAKQEQGEPYGYVDAKGGGLFIYGEHQFQNTKNAELVPVYLHSKQEQGEPEEGEWIEVSARWGKRFVEMPNPLLGDNYIARFYFEPQQRTWVGLTWNDVPDEWVGKVAFMEGAKWADKQLKKKNT
jgi:hypothetical protein